MKCRLCLVLLLVIIAGVAGFWRSSAEPGAPLNEVRSALSGEPSDKQVREEIRKNYELAAGSKVMVVGINGFVKIETADITTAEVYVERVANSNEALSRRRVDIENTPNSLTIRAKKGDVGFIASIFGSSPRENVTLKLPRKIALNTVGVNGAVTVGEIDGPVEIQGINGKVDVAQATGSAELQGINGNISVGMSGLDHKGISLSGVNGNINLKLAPGVDVKLEANGMNGNVVCDLPDFVMEEARHGRYSARLGSGGNEISANGINGNIELSRTKN